MAKREVIVVFGNQLVPDHPALRKHPDAKVVMIEADDICQAHMYHKHKLMLVFSAMRSYADGLNRDVEYIQYQPGTKFKILLQDTLAELLTTDVIWMHASDRGPNRMLSDLCTRQGYKATVYPNKQFMTTTALFGSWLDAQKSINPLMETFYRWQRTRLDILMDGAKPTGGKWNYDHDNRKPLPKNHIEFPALPPAARTDHVRDIAELIDRYFGDNPGSTDTFWLPTTRREALTWLSSFVSDRLAQFGTYEDAMRQDTPFLYHSVLSPLLNVGLLTPDECVKAALNAHDKEAPLNSVEGFIRQIIGWREFVHGLYWWKSDSFKGNFFGFSKPLETWWFSGQDIPDDLPLPLKDCLRRVHNLETGFY